MNDGNSFGHESMPFPTASGPAKLENPRKGSIAALNELVRSHYIINKNIDHYVHLPNV